MNNIQENGALGAQKDITERMRESLGKGVVALQRYNILRSNHPDSVVIAMEGDDDPIFYQTVIKQIKPCLQWKPFVCNGKDKVLELRLYLNRNLSEKKHKTYYIVDRDFDDAKGHTVGQDLYITPTYSIENLLVTEDALEQILSGEFRCIDDDSAKQEIILTFKKLMSDFYKAMELVNRAIHYCRKKNIKTNSIENSLKKYVTVSLDGIEIKYTESDIAKLIGLPDDFEIEKLHDTADEFDKLDPSTRWRGKFIYAFFIAFLTQLKEDRCNKKPKYFSEKKSINFNPNNTMVRALTAASRAPECLRIFVDSITP
ncbi:DUF4435 domain-containing protein [Amylibacter sp. SFDW26]|uniref:DUF4435 domain-containing protein n=1 Tax=Amylibacter sp. SFDW26 TaxID=2652722 RepID=UPI001261A977|nr:DUF4435 domain-containing protein [Amylibacter sp. SFDW26]KAB7615437.1 DUF4435 domain-containing protein [Amylibacter sp. SFDW26]